MKKLVIGGRSFDLIMNMLTVDKIDEVCSENEDMEAYLRRNMQKFQDVPGVLPTLLYANNDDVPDAKWFKRNMTPAMAMKTALVIMEELNDALRMETNEEDEGPIDVGLRELRKKETADG